MSSTRKMRELTANNATKKTRTINRGATYCRKIAIGVNLEFLLGTNSVTETSLKICKVLSFHPTLNLENPDQQDGKSTAIARSTEQIRAATASRVGTLPA